ncbi:MAG: glutathione S-transferase N-terminal domain-containing protein [Myxococcales bacterium]|nr:glutathione S-transferase N-terminal domain-containing protein [Myxococcales bacterium]
MNRAVDVTTSYLSSVLELGAGLATTAQGARPEKRLELYEFEACPFCRKVREALSELDLEALVYPCPKGGGRFRAEVERRGGKAQFPFLVDPNTGRELYESAAIVRYLYATYGSGRAPFRLALGPLDTARSAAASLARAGKGARHRPARAPERPLELWSFEASPYCRLARETLCELELPYVLHNVAKRSPGRPAFVARSGKMQVPYLFDPNTGREMFESADIVRYLAETYAL